MKRLAILSAAAITVLSATSYAGETPANIKAGIDNPLRTDDNRARDEARKPAKVLTFFGIENGMRIVDISSGAGYFTEILSGAVGPKGRVHAQNTAGPRINDRIGALTEHYDQFGNISLDITEPGAPLPYEDNTVDMIMLSLIIHHLHYNEASGETMPESTARYYSEFRRVLKPGGVFAVIEHKAPDGTTRQQSAEWHRISEDVMKADITSAGFTFDGANDKIHNNPDDDEQSTWFDSLRGKTTRLVHRYRSPD